MNRSLEVVQAGDTTWFVASATKPGVWYQVTLAGGCSCPAGRRGCNCRHVAAILTVVVA